MGVEEVNCQGVVKRDADGDFVTVCNSSLDCPYRNVVRDCDGDFIAICHKG